MNDWFVIYEKSYDPDTLKEVITQFVGGFLEKKDAQAFLKLKKREKADLIKRGWISFFVEKRPLFE